MPGIDGFEQGEFVEVLEHQVAEAGEYPGPLASVGSAPDAALESAGRSANRVIDIRSACSADRAEQTAVARGEAVEGGAVAGRPKSAIDEQPGLGLQGRGPGNPDRFAQNGGHTVYLFTASQSICAPSPGRDGTTSSPDALMSSGVMKKSRRSGVQPGGS